MPDPEDLRQAAEAIRAIIERTAELPGDSPSDARLRDRLDLAAEVMEASASEDLSRRDDRHGTF